VRSSRTIRTLYDVLGVRSNADAESIAKAFREATKAYHPDMHGGDEAAVSRFQDIVAAFAILRDPDRRAAYDLRLRRRRRREWLDAVNLCMVAGAIIGGGLVIGRLVLSATPPKIVLPGQPSVAVPAAQPGEGQIRTQPHETQIRTQPHETQIPTQPLETQTRTQPLETQTRTQPLETQIRTHPLEAQIRTQPDSGSNAVREPDTSASASGPTVASRESVQLKSAGETALAPVASAEPSQPHLDASEISSLMKRGTEFVANGNIGAARMMFKLAAEAGDAAAAFAFAETYDPSVLEKLGAKGITPDVALAQQWYEKARALGSTATPGQLSGLLR
jgi:curved DNA-binding protein CbpA